MKMRHQGNRRRWALALGITATAVAMCAAAVAVGGGGGFPDKTRSASKTLAGGADGSATASCPPGQRVVGGGFDSEFVAGASGPAIVPNELIRSSGRDWRVSATNTRTGSGNAGKLTAIAVCGPAHFHKHKAPSIVVATGSQTVEPGYTRPAMAVCPKGTIVVFPGLVFDPWDPGGNGPKLAVTGFGSIINFRTLAVFAANTGLTTGTIEAIAYCSKSAHWSARVKVRHLAPNARGSATATCPASKSLLFGGVVADIDSFASGSLAADYLTSYKQISRRSFHVAGVNLGPGNGFVTAQAFCR